MEKISISVSFKTTGMPRMAILVLLATVICASCSTLPFKPGPQYDKDYYSNVRGFVQSIIDSDRRSRGSIQFLLEDSVTTHGIEICLKDSSTFTDEERNQISEWAAHPPFSVWTTQLVSEARLIRSDTITRIFDNRVGDGWTYFYSHFGPEFNSLGCPLFLRNYAWCLCYSANYCGNLCAEGSVKLYKKEGNGWVVIKTWRIWVS